MAKTPTVLLTFNMTTLLNHGQVQRFRVTGMVIGGILLIYFGWVVAIKPSLKNYFNYREIGQDAVFASAKVYDFDMNQAHGCQPHVEFEDLYGHTHTFIDSTYFDWKIGCPDIGSEIRIRYQRGNPKQAMIDSFWGVILSNGKFLLVGCALSGFGLVMVLAVLSMALIKKKKHTSRRIQKR